MDSNTTDDDLNKKTMNILGVHYKNSFSNHLYIDGVSCLGKTDMLRKIKDSEGISISYNDLSERCQYIYNNFSNKSTCNILQSAYSLLNMHLKPRYKCSIIDRSPLTDFWYSIILKVLESMKKEEKKLNIYNNYSIMQKGELSAKEQLDKFLFIDPYKLSNIKNYVPNDHTNNDNNNNILLKMILKDIFFMYKTLVVIPHHYHVPQIFEKMKSRNNGIDILDPLYVHAQIIVFDNLRKYYDLPNFEFYDINSNVELFSDKHLEDFKIITLKLYEKQLMSK